MGPLLLLPLSIAAGYLAGALTARREVRREIEHIRSSITSARETTAPASARPEPVAPSPSELTNPAASEEVSPEVLTIISAAVAAFLGKKARVRSARWIRPTTPTSVWAQQGRVFVQASHNLPLRVR